jgi:hypothetical protein
MKTIQHIRQQISHSYRSLIQAIGTLCGNTVIGFNQDFSWSNEPKLSEEDLILY